MLQSDNFSMFYTATGPDGFRGIEIYKTATSFKPCIQIDLAEPVSKNNTETMKLIFDFDITIE